MRAAAGIVWPLAVVALLSSRSAQAAIIARRGSMPSIGAVEFAAGVVLVWYGLATTSLHEQAIPVGIYFNRIFAGTTVTLWRIGFAAAWVLAGVLVLGGRKSGWVIAMLVTIAAIASEVLLAFAGGSDALAERTLAEPGERFRVAMAMPWEPEGPWLAALWRGAGPLCLLLFLVAPHVLMEDEPDETQQQKPSGQAAPCE